MVSTAVSHSRAVEGWRRFDGLAAPSLHSPVNWLNSRSDWLPTLDPDVSVCLSLCVCVFVCPRSYLRNYTQCTRSLGLGYKLCAVTPAAGQRTHGTTFRALKVTSQVATPGAESAVHDCLVIIGPHRSTRLDTIAGRGLFMPMFRGLSVCLLTSSAKWLSGSR